MLDVLFKNATIITMCSADAVISCGCVGVSGKHIAYVGEGVPDEKALRTIDCTNRILMPGLVNAHAHTAMTLMRGFADDMPLQKWLFEAIFPVEARLSERDISAGVRLGLAEQIATGTTSISDMYFHEHIAAEAVIEAGTRAHLCNAVIALDADAFDKENDRSIRDLMTLVRDYDGAGDGRVRADASIHAPYTSPPKIWRFVCELADEHKLDLQIHISETQSENDEFIAKYGETPVELLAKNGVFDRRVVAAHCVWVSQSDMDILARYGVTAAHCPRSNLKLGSGVANVSEMIKRGVNVALGTDGCASNNTHDMIRELDTAALIAKGVSLDPSKLCAYDALKLATVNGAKAQGLENVTGRICEGLEADIILIDANTPSITPMHDPLSAVVYAASGSDVCLTMVQGRVLYENGEFLTLDIERILSDARKAALAL